ncbi:MAG: hypothetical protein AAGA77_04710 [Bacteroidota bacterium]
MISESAIEEVIGHYENDEKAYIQTLANIMETQPALLAFIGQESIDILLEEEKDILWYIVLIIYAAIEKSDFIIPQLSDKLVSENEEKNWTLFQEQPKGTFRDRVTVFFDGYDQEDLLAFVEDTLELDDASPMTSVGREVIFITAKSIIDTLLPS